MNASETTVLVTLTGRDRPGVTSRLFTALAAERGLSVLDIEQVVTRGRIVLCALVTDRPRGRPEGDLRATVHSWAVGD